MKDSNHEFIQKIVFDDGLTEIEFKAALNDEQRANELAAEVECWKTLHEGLNLLKDVPEPQITIDRVRLAILASGLKPKRNYAAFGWVLAMGCAFISCFVVVSSKQALPTPVTSSELVAANPISFPSTTILDPTVPASTWSNNHLVASNQSVARNPSGDTITTKDSALSGPKGMTAFGGMLAEMTPVNRDAQKLTSRHQVDPRTSVAPLISAGSSSEEPIPHSTSIPKVGNGDFAPTGANSGAARSTPADNAEAAIISPDSSNSGTVVMIAPQRDAKTGLPQAKEVNNVSDVLLGD